MQMLRKRNPPDKKLEKAQQIPKIKKERDERTNKQN